MSRFREFISRSGHRLATVAGFTAMTLAVTATAASAQTSPPSTDLTNGAGDTFVASLTSYYQDHVLPASLIILAMVVGVGVLVKYVRRWIKA